MFLKRLKSLSMVLLAAALVFSNQTLTTLAVTYSDSNIEDEISIDTVEIKKGETITADELIEKFDLEVDNKTVNVNGFESKVTLPGGYFKVVDNEGNEIWNTKDTGDVYFEEQGTYKIYKVVLKDTLELSNEAKEEIKPLQDALNAAKADELLVKGAETLAQKDYDKALGDLNDAESAREEAEKNLDIYKTALDIAKKALKYAGFFVKPEEKAKLQAAVDKAQDDYDRQMAVLQDAETFKASLVQKEAEEKVNLEEAKAKTLAAAETVKAAQEALNTKMNEIEADLVNNVAIDYTVATEAAYTFTVNIYNELKVVVNGAENVEITVEGTNGKLENGNYKVYLSNPISKVTVPAVDGHALVSVKLTTATDTNGKDLPNNEGVYTVGSLEEDSKVVVNYKKFNLSDINIAVGEHVETITVNDGNTVVADGSSVEEGTELTLNATVKEGYALVNYVVKKYNVETGKYDIDIEVEGNKFVVVAEASSYEVSAVTKYVASTIEVVEKDTILSVTLKDELGNDASTGFVKDGTTVTIVPEATLGNDVTGVKVNTTTGEEVTVTANGDGTYSFTTVGGVDYEVEILTDDVTSTFYPGEVDFSSVKVEVNGKELTASTHIAGLVENTDVKVKLTAVKGQYVKDTLITDGTNEVVVTKNDLGKGVVELTFKAAKKSGYYITVETAPVLEASGNEIVVNKFDIYKNDYEQIKSDILSQGFNKAEGLSNDDITIQYYAGKIDYIGELWFNLDIDAQTEAVKLLERLAWIPGVDSLIESVKTTVHDFGQLDEEQIKVQFKGNNQYTAVNDIKTTVFIEDLRLDTLLDVNTEVEVVYGEYTDEELLALIIDGRNGLTDAEGNVLPELNAEVKLDTTYEGANAGTHTVLVVFDDQISYEYKGCTAEVTLIVHKAKSETTVNSTVTEYGINIDNLITTTPENVKHTSFILGLDIEKQSTLIHVNLPELVDLDALPEIVQNIVKPILDRFSTWEGSLSDLAPYLESLLNALEGVEGNDYINLDTNSIKTLVEVLTKVSNLEGIANVTIKLTIDQDVTPTNAGAYLVGAVTTDMNYETSYGLGYLVIKPQTTQVELAFNVVDENGFITSKAIKDGYDLGSHVVNDAAPAEYLTNIYFGVTVDGEYYIANEPTSTIGAYTQLAYIFNIGNEMYYATPIVRAYAVVSDIVNVDFEEGKELVVEFDNQQHRVTPIVTDRNGTLMTKGTLKLTYVGVQTNGQLYKSTEAPKHAGVYTAVATYIEYDAEGDVTNVGMGVASLVIKPTQSTVTVGNAFHVYDENKFDLTQLVDAKSTVENITPDTTVITFKVEADGDVSENGINGITNVINVDLPKWLDKVLKDNGKFEAAYNDGYLLANELTKYLDTISNTLVEKDLISQQGIEEIIAQLKQLPTDVKVTLLETKEVSPYAVGIYGVVAIVTDSDHLPAVDYGVLVISPEFTKAELEWNYVDANGIITTPVLKDIDFNASAFVESVLNEELTNKVQYLFIGLDKDGKFVTTTDASDLTIGAYTEIAYVISEIGVEIFVVEPIVRSFVVTPQTVDVTFVDENGNENNDRIFVYNGQPQGMDVVVKEMNGSVITGERLENLSVVYTGITTSGEKYNSTTRPTDAGVYTVVAEYYEVNEKGDLLHTGMEVGYMVIKPGKAELEVVDTTVTYDGNEHMATINNPENLTLITIVVDENGNVNINLPVVTYATARAISLENAIELISHYINNEEVLEQLKQFVEDLNVRVVTINGENPVEVGTYKVYAIGFDANFELTIDNGTLVIEKQETTEPEDPKDPVDPEDPTDPTDPKDPVDPENPTDPKDPVDPENPTDKPADKEETDKPVTPEKPADKEETNKPVDPEEKPESPVTSDTVYVGLFSLMALLSAAILLVLRKKAELSK